MILQTSKEVKFTHNLFERLHPKTDANICPTEKKQSTKPIKAKKVLLSELDINDEIQAVNLQILQRCFFQTKC